MNSNMNKGGKNYKKQKNSTRGSEPEKRVFVYKEEGQEYALVEKALGGSRFKVITPDNRSFVGVLRGKFRGRSKGGNFVEVGGFVLLAFRDFGSSTKLMEQGSAHDIIGVYTHDESKHIKSLFKNLKQIDNIDAFDLDDNDEDDGFVFEEL